MKGGLADADDRRIRQRARRIEPGIVEAGDDMRVRARRLALPDSPSRPGTAKASS